MILLWGIPHDSPMAAVLAATGAAAPDGVLFLDQSHCGEIEGELATADGSVSGWVASGSRRAAVEELSGYYLRPHAQPRQRDGAVADDYVVDMTQLLLTLAEVAPPATAVLNRPSAMAGNDSKPAQAEEIRAAGFAVPDAVVTTDRDVAEAFWDRQGSVVYKSTSGIRSVATELTEAHRSRLEHLSTCPTHFQELVPGDDYRVHVVGDELFATRIVSRATDYRYAGDQGFDRTMTATELPDDVAERCVSLTRVLGLLLTGIDLRLTPDGDWYCFEVNTSPAFTWFEEHTGQPIAAAVAALLRRGGAG